MFTLYSGTQLVLRCIDMKYSLLTCLDLFHNDLGPEGARLVYNALRSNCTLKSLYLGGNHFGVDGAEHMAQLLKENNTLTHIALDLNDCQDTGAKCIVES